MPSRPLKPCAHPACSVLVAGGQRRCPAHRAQDPRHLADERKGWTRQFYGEPRWRAVRAAVLQEEPVCPCGVPSTTVDHIESLRARPDLAYSRENLRALCTSCHNSRTAKGNSNFHRRPDR